MRFNCSYCNTQLADKEEAAQHRQAHKFIEEALRLKIADFQGQLVEYNKLLSHWDYADIDLSYQILDATEGKDG